MVIVRTRSVTTGFLPSVSVQNVVERAVILSRGGGPVRFDLALPAENVPRQRGRPLSKKSVAFLNDDELQRVTTAFCPPSVEPETSRTESRARHASGNQQVSGPMDCPVRTKERV